MNVNEHVRKMIVDTMGAADDLTELLTMTSVFYSSMLAILVDEHLMSAETARQVIEMTEESFEGAIDGAL